MGERDPIQAYRPSDVVLDRAMPLVGTMGKAEVEAAAGWMVLALRDRDDEWGPVTPLDCRGVHERHGATFSWLTNPFLVPDFWALVARGFAAFDDEGGKDKGRPVRFTPAGIDAMRKWVPRG